MQMWHDEYPMVPPAPGPGRSPGPGAEGPGPGDGDAAGMRRRARVGRRRRRRRGGRDRDRLPAADRLPRRADPAPRPGPGRRRRLRRRPDRLVDRRSHAAPTFPEAPNVWKASVTDCDIIREHLKMKKVTHPAGNGKSWVPCQVMNRTTIGPGGTHSFTYTNHRPDCPIRMGRVSEPAWSDNYMAWVFRQGITAPKQGAWGVQGDAWSWAHQAAADMASTLPKIREGAGTAAWPYPYWPYYYPYSYYPYYYP